MDCDPGLDDAIAILMALASPESIDLLGITTVAGNGPLPQTTANAQRICELAGRPDVKIFAGCARPFFAKADYSTYDGGDIHGQTGLGDCKLPAPSMPVQSQHAVNFIIETVLNASEPVTIAASGPLTNLAAALILEPRIHGNIERIVLMGGAISLGNITPSAEYNFYCDPQAAHVVFTSTLPLVMLGLDVTRQTNTSETWLRVLEGVETPVSLAVQEMLAYFHRPDAILEPGVSGGVLHDPNLIAYLLHPELYKGKNVYVDIDVSPTLVAGRSTVDWYHKLGRSPNAYVINEVDASGFFKLLLDKLCWYGA